jgi:hypothetical protein
VKSTANSGRGDTCQRMIVKLSRLELVVLWVSLIGICAGAGALSVSLIVGIAPSGGVSPIVTVWFGIGYLCLTVAYAAYLLIHARREEWFRASFTFDSHGVVKQMPSGAVQAGLWRDLVGVTYGRVLHFKNGESLRLSFVGGCYGFSSAGMRTVAEMSGKRHLFGFAEHDSG